MTAPQPDPYDEVPYESHPFPFAQPSRMAAVGRLFGMAPADVHTARVLEIGCGLGIHLLPLAARYPDARFVGIDYSKVQIDSARRFQDEVARDATGGETLDNLEFRHMSVADIGPADGKFDYIICHGVYSWVPDPVRDEILRVCRENLSPDGLALISYNTFPGWHPARAVAEMMRFHTESLGPSRAKAASARNFVGKLVDGVSDRLPGYRDALKFEQDLFSKNSDSYLLHDHLGAHNQPFYFHEVARRADAAGLAYVAEINPEVVALDEFPAAARELLAGHDDIVRFEQYFDFIVNRRFRTTLFCRRAIRPDRRIDSRRIFEFHIQSNFPSVDPASVDLAGDAPARFVAKNGTTVETANRFLRAAMLALSNLGKATASAEEIVAAAAALVHGAPPDEAAARTRAEFVGVAMSLVFRGALHLHSAALPFARQAPAKPRAFLPSRTSSRHGHSRPWNLVHELVTVEPAEAALLALCDGTRDVPALAEALRCPEETVRDRLARCCMNALLV